MQPQAIAPMQHPDVLHAHLRKRCCDPLAHSVQQHFGSMHSPAMLPCHFSALHVQSAAVMEASPAVQACQMTPPSHSQMSAAQHCLCQDRRQRLQAAASTALRAYQTRQALLRSRPQLAPAPACATTVLSAGVRRPLHA